MSTFRKQYRELSEDEKNIIEDIKDVASNLEWQIERMEPGRCRSLAMTKLEEAVMWAVKGATG